MNFETTPYEPWQAYGRSKTANVLFAVELDRRGRDRGQRACAVHPGTVPTELSRYLTHETLESLPTARANVETVWKESPAGAATSVWAAFVGGGDEVGGRYCEDCHVGEIVDDLASPTGVFAYALDPRRRSTARGPDPKSSSASRSRTERSASWRPAKFDRWHS